MAGEPRICVFYDPSDKDQACEPYRTTLQNGDEIYCARCRANKHYWQKKHASDLRAYSYRLRFRSARLTEWVGGAREKVVTLMTKEMRVRRRG